MSPENPTALYLLFCPQIGQLGGLFLPSVLEFFKLFFLGEASPPQIKNNLIK
jgi:hypothetical protein